VNYFIEGRQASSGVQPWHSIRGLGVRFPTSNTGPLTSLFNDSHSSENLPKYIWNYLESVSIQLPTSRDDFPHFLEYLQQEKATTKKDEEEKRNLVTGNNFRAKLIANYSSQARCGSR